MFNSFKYNSTKYNSVGDFFNNIVTSLIVTRAISLTTVDTAMGMSANDLKPREYTQDMDTAGLTAGDEALALSTNNETVILR